MEDYALYFRNSIINSALHDYGISEDVRSIILADLLQCNLAKLALINTALLANVNDYKDKLFSNNDIENWKHLFKIAKGED